MIRKLLTQTLNLFFRRGEIDDDDVAWCMRIDLAAGDSTRFESRHCSRYFTNRRKQGRNKGSPRTNPPTDPGADHEPVAYHRFPKLGILVDCQTHFILSAKRGVGPRSDVDQLKPLLLTGTTNACKSGTAVGVGNTTGLTVFDATFSRFA